MVKGNDWKVISKDLEKISIQNLVPERSLTCLALGFMQIRVGGGTGQDDIDEAR